MKATGICRGVDSLGRIVIPKEIRKNLHIREGDPLEIFTDHDGMVILRKYSPIGEMDKFAKEYAESIAKVTDYRIIITDRNHVIAIAGGAVKHYQDKEITKDIEHIMEKRKLVTQRENMVSIIEGDSENYSEQTISPIICNGDVVGSVIVLPKKEDQHITEKEEKIAQIAAEFLGKQVE